MPGQCHIPEFVGRTPWSARVPLDPLFANEISFIHAVQADGGVGCGPGGPPHNRFRLCGCWGKYVGLDMPGPNATPPL